MRFLASVGTLVLLTGGAIFAEPVRIGAIRIIGNAFTEEEVVRDYITDFNNGDVVAAEALDDALRRLEDRLMATGYFYDALAIAVPAAAEPGTAGPGTVNVVVEVTEGFRYRFGGGAAYGYFGIANLGGTGKEIGVMAGYNAQAVAYSDHHTGLGRLFWEIDGGNRPGSRVDQDGGDRPYQDVGGALTLGWDFPRDWRFGVGGARSIRYAPDYGEAENLAWIDATLSRQVTSGFFSAPGHRLSFSLRNFAPDGVYRGSADARIYLPLGSDALLAALRIGGALQTDADRDLLDLSLMEIDGVRRNFTDRGFGSGVWQANLELRWKALRRWADTVTLEPALFVDAGAAALQAGEPFGTPLFGYGTALRIYFAAPVYVPLRLEWAWGDGSTPRFYLAVEAPF